MRVRPATDGTSRRCTVIARADALPTVDCAKQFHGPLRRHPEWWCHVAVGIVEHADIAADASYDFMSNVSRNTLGTILRSLQDARPISIGYGKI